MKLRLFGCCLNKIKIELGCAHGPVGDKAQFSVYRDLLVTVRDKVATLNKQGGSLTEIVAAKPTAAYDAKWGGGFMNPANFTGLVFQGV